MEKYLVGHIDEGRKYQQHSPHIDGQPESVGSAAGNRIEQVVAVVVGHPELCIGADRLRLRVEHLSRYDGCRCRNDRSCQQVLGKIALRFGIIAPQKTYISHKYTACDGSHTPGHEAENLRLTHACEVGPYDQRRFRLSDEYIGCCCQTLRPCEPHGFCQQPGKAVDYLLQYAKIIQNGSQRTEKNDGRQHLKSKNVAKSFLVLYDTAKKERSTRLGKLQDSSETFRHQIENIAHAGNLQDHHRQQQLQPQPNRNEAPVDGCAVVTQGITDAQQYSEAQRSSRSRDNYFHIF